MTVTREEIMAYVDGEADEVVRQRVEAVALADEGIAAQIAAERRMRQQLRAHFGPVEKEPVPPAWEAMIRAAAGPVEAIPVVNLAEARARRDETARRSPPAPWRRAWIGGAMAASLVLGLFLGAQRQGSTPVATTDGGVLIAQGNLANALDKQLASAQDDAGLRMLATFRDAQGTVCRAFTGEQVSGIACHDDARWQVRHLLPGRPHAQAQYRQAGTPDTDLMALAQEMAAGDPFDARQEAQARSRGWR